LFEQFNYEPSVLEKKSRSLFDEPEENLKPINSIFDNKKAEKKTNNEAVPLIFGSVEDYLLKPIQAQKLKQINKPNNIQKNNNANKNIQNNAGPIKNLVKNQVANPSAEKAKKVNIGKINYFYY
jgi:response regulator of citrate/malate metabolism